MRKKKHHHEEHEEHVNHEAWVIPYADMLTLLMAMFLVLWAIGQTDISKAKAVSSGFSDEFGLSGSPGRGAGGTGVLDGSQQPVKNDPIASRNKPDQAAAVAAVKKAQQAEQAQQAAAQQEADIQARINQEASQSGLATALRFHTETRGLVVSIVTEGVLFDGGSATLTPEGNVILDDLAGVLAGLPNSLMIEGHTDDRPISTPQFPSNWELSTARATSVLRYLAERHGIPPARLSAAGYADQRPVAPNSTDGGRARNRRVDIVILTQAAAGGVNTGATPTTTSIPVGAAPEAPVAAPTDLPNSGQ